MREHGLGVLAATQSPLRQHRDLGDPNRGRNGQAGSQGVGVTTWLGETPHPWYA